MILCDAVRRDRRTGDPTVVRAFTAFDVPSFPATTGPFCVWIQLTDGAGRTTMRLFVEHVPPDTIDVELVTLIEFTLDFADPNAVLDYDAKLLAGIALEKVGRYRLRLEADGITISQRYFAARQGS
ncbi:MAG TPA: hypothetical protein VFY71_02920 [Planctomycetota bacterium]|nr:hypothetical protein [Planctomycetota bacterium]